MSNSGILSRIDVIVHTGPVEWWQIVAAIGPYAVLLGFAAIALGYCLVHPAPRDDFTKATSSAAGWERTRWAIEAATDPDPRRRTAGLAVLDQLSGSHLLDEDSAKIVEQSRELLKDD